MFKTFAEMVKELGEEKVFKLAMAQLTNVEYRKRYRMTRDAILEEAMKRKDIVEKVKAKLNAGK